MNSMNRVTVSGRLGRDVEVRYTAGGKAVASFSLAVEDSVKKDQVYEKRTSWVDCEIWGKPAEFLANDSRKGAVVVVDGKLKQNVWEKDGKKSSRIVVLAAMAYVVKARDEMDQTPAADNADQRPPIAADDIPDVGGDNLPF